MMPILQKTKLFVQLLLLTRILLCHSFSLPNDANAAVIVPGFLTGQREFEPLADLLTNKHGITTVVVPMAAWHWLPCVAGRSVRPMLERIDYTVRHLSASIEAADSKVVIPPFSYNAIDCFQDFMTNPGGVNKVGGSDEVDEYPTNVVPKGSFPPPSGPPKARVALIGLSAGGFISRAYLSRRPYAGKAYNGTDLVHSLVTLGTPHANAPGAAFKTVEWCNREPCPGRALAVGAVGTHGNSSGFLTRGSYAFCSGGDGTAWDGDGLTTIQSALALEGECVEKRTFFDVTHYPWTEAGIVADLVAPELTRQYRNGRPWYGDEVIVEQWVDFLKQPSAVQSQ